MRFKWKCVEKILKGNQNRIPTKDWVRYYSNHFRQGLSFLKAGDLRRAFWLLCAAECVLLVRVKNYSRVCYDFVTLMTARTRRWDHLTDIMWLILRGRWCRVMLSAFIRPKQTQRLFCAVPSLYWSGPWEIEILLMGLLYCMSDIFVKVWCEMPFFSFFIRISVFLSQRQDSFILCLHEM